ncbi:MAG: hypothetical protein NVS4B11_09840 [Ktedonobacteraceae bacterium]
MRPDEMIGKIVGHYRIVRPLGMGGTSMVFLAQDINLQRDVALKMFQPREGETQDFLRRFAREARVVAQLDHPNILPVYDYGEEHDIAYLVMPQMLRGSLRDLLRTRSTLPAQEAIQIIGPILQALQYAHTRGLIHRDIKPGNMLFKADGTPMLSDFGLVKVTSTSSSEATVIMDETASMTGHAIAGTPDYMSPEQITGKVTPASDIYSMGVVLYEMLTGIRPFSAENYMSVLMKQMYERPRPLRDLNPQIPPALEAVVLHALEKEVSKRYQSPEALRQALLQTLSASTSATPYDSVATVSAWPTVEHSAFRQQSGEQKLIVGEQSTPVTPSSQTHTEAQYSTPATPPGGQRLYNQSHPVTAPPIVTGGKLISPTRRLPIPLIAMLIIVALFLIAGLGTALLAPQVFGFGKHPGPVPTVTTVVAHKPTGTAVKGGATTGSTPGVTLVTQNVPATTTACPATGTARAAVLAPLVLGSHQNLVYIVNEFNPAAYGTIKRRDVNTPDLKATEVVKMPNVSISEAQVSQDGQWVLFTARFEKQDQIRMVRVDGQGLQTLYCAPVGSFILSSQWSFNQQSVVFDSGLGGANPTTYLLNVNSGTVQPELVPQGAMGYLPRTWLDATHVYLVGFFPQSAHATLQNLYLLDTQKGTNQHDGDLTQVVAVAQGCMNFDTSYDVKQLYFSTCSGDGSAANGFNGPSSITVQDARGSSAKTIFTSPTMAITTVRAISQTTLLLMVENTTGDTSQNGLWKINIDGTGLMRLSTDTANAQSLCVFSQYAWSNVSFDHNFYALQSYQQDTHTYGMFYGSLNGGTPDQFAGISDGTQLFLAGWTKM